MVPVPLLKIRTPSQNELYACQVKLAAPGQNLEPRRQKRSKVASARASAG